MDLIDRYLYEVGKHLPSRQRKDILSELGSSIQDALEARSVGDPDEETVIALLKELGRPKDVASSYYPQGQYLIGPELYPLFKLVLGITLAAVIGAQLLALSIAFFLTPRGFELPGDLLGIINSLPAALGSVVIVFAILQRFEVRPEGDEPEFDPRKLPKLEGVEPVSRGEQVFSIIVDVVVLTWLAYFASQSVFSGEGGLRFLTNPVIVRYLPWIGLSIIVGIVVDIVLLWQGRWKVSLRVAKIAANVFSLVLLGLLIQGHNVWLANVDVLGYLDWLARLEANPTLDTQLVGMASFRIFFTVAFIITLIETAVQVFRIVQGMVRTRDLQGMGYESV